MGTGSHRLLPFLENLVQIGVAAVVVLIVIEPLRKAANKIIFK